MSTLTTASADVPHAGKARRDSVVSDDEDEPFSHSFTSFNTDGDGGGAAAHALLAHTGGSAEKRAVALCRAAYTGNVEKVRALCARGASPAYQTRYGKSALHNAVFKGHVDIVNVLLKAGASVHLGDSFGYTPLHLAAAEDHTRLVPLLLDAGADRYAQDIQGRDCLALARTTKMRELLEEYETEEEKKESLERWEKEKRRLEAKIKSLEKQLNEMRAKK